MSEKFSREVSMAWLFKPGLCVFVFLLLTLPIQAQGSDESISNITTEKTAEEIVAEMEKINESCKTDTYFGCLILNSKKLNNLLEQLERTPKAINDPSLQKRIRETRAVLQEAVNSVPHAKEYIELSESIEKALNAPTEQQPSLWRSGLSILSTAGLWVISPGTYLLSYLWITPESWFGLIAAIFLSWWLYATAIRLVWIIPGRVFGFYNPEHFGGWLKWGFLGGLFIARSSSFEDG